jgi:hypothetical protein
MRNFRGLLCLLLAAQGRIAAIRDDDDSASSLSRAIAAVLPS